MVLHKKKKPKHKKIILKHNSFSLYSFFVADFHPDFIGALAKMEENILFYVYSTTIEDEKSCIKNTFIVSIVSYVAACCSVQRIENCILNQSEKQEDNKHTNSAKV